MKYTICLDYLEIFAKAFIEKPKPCKTIEGKLLSDVINISDQYTMVYEGYGVQRYQSLYTVYSYGEKLLNLKAHPRKTTKDFKENHISIKMENNLLYTDYWIEELYKFSELLKIELLNISRLDIALDGTNEIIPLLNEYLSQNQKSKHIHMAARAKLNSYDFNHTTMMHEKFSIGKSVSEKVVAIYNKTNELKQSNKSYIPDFWKYSGLDQPAMVYRTEIRFKSKALKRLETDFANYYGSIDSPDLYSFNILDNLTEKQCLISLFRSGIDGFLEFRKGKGNVSRMQKIDLFDLSKTNSVLLSRCDTKPPDDKYKAKLTIHLLFKIYYTKEYLNFETSPNEREIYNRYKKTIEELLQHHGLESWYEAKEPEWQKLYRNEKIKNQIKTK